MNAGHLGIARFAKISLIGAAILITIFTAVYYGQMGSPTGTSNLLSSFQVESVKIIGISNYNGLVYVASTSEEQVQGFQNATQFGSCNGHANATSQCIGMIFIFQGEQILCFWMHNTIMPLEQVWVSSNGTVVAVYEAQPENNNSICHVATYVLETSPGMKVSVGDRLTLGNES
ncbi:MAG: DUF192 domain-containing protein [Nitrososphaerales archaeon]